jgi:hypothetical protein
MITTFCEATHSLWFRPPRESVGFQTVPPTQSFCVELAHLSQRTSVTPWAGAQTNRAIQDVPNNSIIGSGNERQQYCAVCSKQIDQPRFLGLTEHLLVDLADGNKVFRVFLSDRYLHATPSRRRTLGFRRAWKPERGTSVGCKASPANPCSAGYVQPPSLGHSCAPYAEGSCLKMTRCTNHCSTSWRDT